MIIQASILPCGEVHLFNLMQLMSNYVRWRIRLRKALSSSSQVTPNAAVTATESKVIDDDQLLQEMEELTSVIDRKKRQDKKRQSRRKAKVFPL
jgi:hypothetical protein